MFRSAAILCLLATLGLVTPATAQTPLSLAEATSRARMRNPDPGASTAATREAGQRVTEARAGYWPRVDVAESWQRGNQPVFVFGSLISQRQFTADNFALGALNYPEAIDNFRSAVTIDQPLFDAGIRARVTAATLAREATIATGKMVEHDLNANVVDAYGRVLIAVGLRQSAAKAAETAVLDRELTGNRRDAGRVTDADVLLAELQVSRAREQEIIATSDERTARARLNQLMGDPLDTIFQLEPAPAVTPIDVTSLAGLEAEAVTNRPEVAHATLLEQLARTNQTVAGSAFLPRVTMQGGWELNGGAWNSRASSWIVGAVARVNIFNGFADKARLAAAREEGVRRALERTKTETSVRFDVHVAVARLEAARAREAVGRDAVAQARESRRIIRDRYEAGLTDVVSLTRSAEAVAQAEAQQIAAQVAVVTETAALQRALGRQ